MPCDILRCNVIFSAKPKVKFACSEFRTGVARNGFSGWRPYNSSETVEYKVNKKQKTVAQFNATVFFCVIVIFRWEQAPPCIC